MNQSLNDSILRVQERGLLSQERARARRAEESLQESVHAMELVYDTLAELAAQVAELQKSFDDMKRGCDRGFLDGERQTERVFKALQKLQILVDGNGYKSRKRLRLPFVRRPRDIPFEPDSEASTLWDVR